MAHKKHEGLWVADDGSWGSGEVVFIDTSEWTRTQWDALDEETNSGDPDIDAVIDIDNQTDE